MDYVELWNKIQGIPTNVEAVKVNVEETGKFLIGIAAGILILQIAVLIIVLTKK